MSTTSTKVTIPLKAISMRRLKEYLIRILVDAKLEAELDNITDTDLHLTVSKPGYRTKLSLQRVRHRPLDIEIEVDFGGVGKIKDVLRTPRPKSEQNSSNLFNYRILWVVIIVGGLLIGAVELATNIVTELAERTDQQLQGIEQFQVILGVFILASLVVLVWVYGLPRLIRQWEQSRQKFDLEVLDIVVNTIGQLNHELTKTDILRCWSCFEQIGLDDNVCPFCGKHQK